MPCSGKRAERPLWSKRFLGEGEGERRAKRAGAQYRIMYPIRAARRVRRDWAAWECSRAGAAYAAVTARRATAEERWTGLWIGEQTQASWVHQAPQFMAAQGARKPAGRRGRER